MWIIYFNPNLCGSYSSHLICGNIFYVTCQSSSLLTTLLVRLHCLESPVHVIKPFFVFTRVACVSYWQRLWAYQSVRDSLYLFILRTSALIYVRYLGLLLVSCLFCHFGVLGCRVRLNCGHVCAVRLLPLHLLWPPVRKFPPSKKCFLRILMPTMAARNSRLLLFKINPPSPPLLKS